jgi:hypothetical protein
LSWLGGPDRVILIAMNLHFDPDDFAVVVKNRANPPKPWRWEIHRAGRTSPVGQSDVYFETMTLAHRAGKAAFEEFMAKGYVPPITGG